MMRIGKTIHQRGSIGAVFCFSLLISVHAFAQQKPFHTLSAVDKIARLAEEGRLTSAKQVLKWLPKRTRATSVVLKDRRTVFAQPEGKYFIVVDPEKQRVDVMDLRSILNPPLVLKLFFNRRGGSRIAPEAVDAAEVVRFIESIPAESEVARVARNRQRQLEVTAMLDESNARRTIQRALERSRSPLFAWTGEGLLLKVLYERLEERLRDPRKPSELAQAWHDIALLELILPEKEHADYRKRERQFASQIDLMLDRAQEMQDGQDEKHRLDQEAESLAAMTTALKKIARAYPHCGRYLR